MDFDDSFFDESDSDKETTTSDGTSCRGPEVVAYQARICEQKVRNHEIKWILLTT